jgi:hypothetical protein
MKKILLLCGMLLALSATVASAAGINLGWDNCLAGAGSNSGKSFACTTNSNTAQYMYLSATAPGGIELWTAFEWIIELQTDAAVISDWWEIRNAGSCRSTVLVAAALGTFSGCTDTYAGNGTGGIGAYNIGFGAPNRARIKGVFAIPSGTEFPLNPEEDYFVARVGINYSKSVGTGSCVGCLEGVCLNGTSVKFVQPAGAPGGSVDVTNPANRSHITWQNPLPATCTGATPAKNVTWGRVKTLYR